MSQKAFKILFNFGMIDINNLLVKVSQHGKLNSKCTI